MIPSGLSSLLANRKKYIDEISPVNESGGAGYGDGGGDHGINLRSTSSSYHGINFHEKSLTGYTGLINQGATCYLNSLLQSLFMVPEFRSSVYLSNFSSSSSSYENENNNSTENNIYNLPRQLQKLFLELQYTSKSAISTSLLTKSFGWTSSDSFIQQDIQECMTVIFEYISNVCPESELALFLRNEWSGEYQNGLTCQNCLQTRWRNEIFRDLQIQVRGMKSIYESLYNYFEEEIMDNVECGNCNGRYQHIKSGKFTKLPYILSLQLRRFDMNWTTMQRIKLNDPIEIATHLVLQESLKSNLEGTSTSQEHEINELPAPKEYELISILVHSGSAYGGHYFCYVKDVFTSSHEAATSSNNSNWLLFNDSTVTSISQDQLNIILGAPSSTSTPTSSHGAQPVVPSANNAYMLLYRQISPINLFDISHSLENLPQDLVKQIQNENSIYLEQKAKYEYERAFLHIALSHLIVGDLHSNDLDAKKSGNPASKYKVFRIHETSSLAELTTMVYNELYLSSPDSQPGNTPRREDVRLRVYDSIKGSLLPPMALFAKDILEKYNLRYPAEEGFIIADQSDLPTQIQMETATVLSSLPDTTLKRVFHLEIKSETENFSILDCGQGIHLNLEICLYCPNPENGESTFTDPYPLQISSNQSLDRLLDAVAEKLSPHHSCWQNQDHQNLVSSVVFVTHDISTGLAKYLYPSKNSNINLSSPLSQLLSNNDRLYVDFDPSSHSRLAEVNPPHISSVITLPESSSRIGLMDYFDGVYNEITLQYTNLNALPDLIRLDIRVDRRLSMGLLKQKIATALNISPNSFIFLRGTDNDSDPQLEIKNLNLSIAESGLQDGSYLRLNFGSPLNNGDYRIHLLQKSVLPVSQQISQGGYNPNSHQIYTKLEPCMISSNQSIQSFKSWYKETYLSNEEGDVNIRVQFTQLVQSEGVPEDTSTSINNQQDDVHEKCLQLYKPLFILSDKKTFKDCLGNQLKDGIYLTITTHVHETAFDDTNDLAIALWEWFIHPLPNNENHEEIKKQHMLIFHEEIVVNKDLSFENFSEYLYLHHISSSHPIPHDQTQYKIYYTKPFTWQLKDIQNIPTLKWSSQPESSSCSLSGPPYRLRNNPQSGSTTLLFYYCTMTDYHHLLQSSQSLTGSDNLIHERLPIEASFRLYTPQEQIIRKKEEEKNEIERKQIIEEKLKILHGTLQKSKNEK